MVSFSSRYLDAKLVERLKGLELSARRVVLGATTGEHRSPIKGASVEFRQHRPYVAGDELRRLDWRVLGRTDRPYVREYDEETNLRCSFLVDCSGSMGYLGKSGTKLEYAGRIVATLAYLMIHRTESVGLGFFGEGLKSWVGCAGGKGQIARIIDGLERAEAGGVSDVLKGMREVADRSERRGLVVVISDFFFLPGEVREGVARLTHDGHEVVLMQVTDRDEEEFAFDSWRRFTGLEGEASFAVEGAMIRRGYLEKFGRHRREVGEGCRGLGGEFVSMVTDEELGGVLARFLERRAVR